MPDHTHRPDDSLPDDQPQIFAVRRSLSGGWTFTRRGFVRAAGAAAAGAALSGCGSDAKNSEPRATATAIPTSTPDFATSRTQISPDLAAHRFADPPLSRF